MNWLQDQYAQYWPAISRENIREQYNEGTWVNVGHNYMIDCMLGESRCYMGEPNTIKQKSKLTSVKSITANTNGTIVVKQKVLLSKRFYWNSGEYISWCRMSAKGVPERNALSCQDKKVISPYIWSLIALISIVRLHLLHSTCAREKNEVNILLTRQSRDEHLHLIHHCTLIW